MKMTAVCTDTPKRARKPMPDDTEKGVPVSFRARRPPTGAESSTARTVMKGNFKLL